MKVRPGEPARQKLCYRERAPQSAYSRDQEDIKQFILRTVHVAPLVSSEALRRAKPHIDSQAVRIEGEGRGVGTGAEAYPIIEALVEHAEHRDTAAGFRLPGQHLGGQRLGTAQPTRNAARSDRRDR